MRTIHHRLFSLRHQNGLNRGKLAVVVTTGIGRGAPGLEETSEQMAYALKLEGMLVLGQLRAVGNPECMVCGYGETCPMSALPWIFGEDTSERKFMGWLCEELAGKEIPLSPTCIGHL